MEWLNAIFSWFGMFFPRVVVVNTTEGGVRWRLGKEISPILPGICIYWPIITEIKLWPLARQVVNLRTQTLVVADGTTVAVGGLIVFEVKDIVLLLTSVYSPDETIKDITASALHDAICLYTWEDLKAAMRSGDLDKALLKEARLQLEKYGVRVIKVTLTDLSTCSVIKVINATAAD